MKKNSIFLLSVCLFITSLSYAQDFFTVIKVNGNIVIERTGSSLGTGVSFPQNENLLFKVPDSRALVLNPDRGRFLITSENLSTFKTSKSNFLPSSSKISTRSFTAGSSSKDLKTHFEGNYLIFDEVRLKIDTAKYPMSGNRFFYLSYNYNDRTIKKKLPFSKDTLVIKKNYLLEVDGITIADTLVKNMQLVYLIGGETYTTTPICTFTPVFPDITKMGPELKVIIDQLVFKSYNEKFAEISDFIREFYGKFDETNLQKWLSGNLGFKQ